MKRITLVHKKQTIAALGKVKQVWTLSAIVLLTALFLGPIQAQAQMDRYVLDFDDQYIGNRKGKEATLLLKRTLKDQYPWVNTRNLTLRNVILVAKSKVGRGYAQLRVGKQQTDYVRVSGHPKRFKRDHRKSFDRIRLYNPSYTSWGPWQIKLHGNFKVRKVILITEQSRRYGRDYYSWY